MPLIILMSRTIKSNALDLLVNLGMGVRRAAALVNYPLIKALQFFDEPPSLIDVPVEQNGIMPMTVFHEDQTSQIFYHGHTVGAGEGGNILMTADKSWHYLNKPALAGLATIDSTFTLTEYLGVMYTNGQQHTVALLDNFGVLNPFLPHPPNWPIPDSLRNQNILRAAILAESP